MHRSSLPAADAARIWVVRVRRPPPGSGGRGPPESVVFAGAGTRRERRLIPPARGRSPPGGREQTQPQGGLAVWNTGTAGPLAPRVLPAAHGSKSQRHRILTRRTLTGSVARTSRPSLKDLAVAGGEVDPHLDRGAAREAQDVLSRPRACGRRRRAVRLAAAQREQARGRACSSEPGSARWAATLTVAWSGANGSQGSRAVNEPGRVPLHRRAHRVAVAEAHGSTRRRARLDVAHAELVAVVERRRAAQRQQQEAAARSWPDPSRVARRGRSWLPSTQFGQAPSGSAAS